MFADLFQKHLTMALAFILLLSLCLGSQNAPAVSLRNNVYQTSSRKYSAKKWIKNGQSKYKRAKFEHAVKAYNKAIASYPGYFEAWEGLGIALYCLGNYDLAIRAYDKALSLRNDAYVVWNNKGIELDELGRHEDALDTYDKVIKLKPDFHAAWFNKACACALLYRRDDALRSLRKAIELNPAYKTMAKQIPDFEIYKHDPEFEVLVSQ